MLHDCETILRNRYILVLYKKLELAKIYEKHSNKNNRRNTSPFFYFPN